MYLSQTSYHSKHLGDVYVSTQYIVARREWTAYAIQGGQYFWTTRGSFGSSIEAEQATVQQIEQQYETQLEKKVPV